MPLGGQKIGYFQGGALEMQRQHDRLKAGGRALPAPQSSHGLGHARCVMFINTLKVCLSVTV